MTPCSYGPFLLLSSVTVLYLVRNDCSLLVSNDSHTKDLFCNFQTLHCKLFWQLLLQIINLLCARPCNKHIIHIQLYNDIRIVNELNIATMIRFISLEPSSIYKIIKIFCSIVLKLALGHTSFFSVCRLDSLVPKQ